MHHHRLSKIAALRILILAAAAVLISIYWKEITLITGDAVRYVRGVELRYVLMAVAIYILSVFLFALRWKIVLSVLGYRVRAGALVPVLFGAISVNNFTPANRMGGEPLRILWVREQFGVGLPQAFISILYERSVEAVPVVALLLYLVSTLPVLQGTVLKIVVYLGIVLLIAISGSLLIRQKFSAATKALMDYSRQLNRAFPSTLFLSSLVWLMDIFRLKLVTLAFGLHLTANIIVVLSLLYLVLGSLPITPGGLGVVDGGLVSALTLFNIPVGVAIGVVTVERFISYVMSGAIGLVCLLYFGGLKIWRSTGLRW